MHDLTPMHDFRSDTVTLPTTAMMAAIAQARLGDAARGDDPTAAAERAFAALARDGWHVATLRTERGTALRCCLLKPEHLGVVDRLADALAGALSA